MRRKPMTLHVTTQQKEQLRALADRRGISIGQLLDEFAEQRYGATG